MLFFFFACFVLFFNFQTHSSQRHGLVLGRVLVCHFWGAGIAFVRGERLVHVLLPASNPSVVILLHSTNASSDVRCPVGWCWALVSVGEGEAVPPELQYLHVD